MHDWARLMFGAFAAIAGVQGVVLLAGIIRHRIQAVPVIVNTIATRASEDTNGSEVAAPVFRIATGPHQGVEWTSRFVEPAPVNEEGSPQQATYNPATGAIHTRRTTRHAIILAVSMSLGALFFGLVALHN